MEQIGRFKVLRRLGGGGFGEVWLGLDETIKREVAIKVFKPKDENLIAFATSSDTEGLDVLRSRFVNEAQILASLEEEPYVVNVMEFGELDDGAPYYVMPYLPRSLTDILGKDIYDARAVEELPEADRPRSLPLDQSLNILEQLLQGLAAAHEQGLVHRDIKPSNIMLTDSGAVRLVDFGIAKAPNSGNSTVSQLGMGSRNYMAPEQKESAKHVDASADIYAAGMVAYRMITGRLATGRFSDPNVLVPELHQSLNDLIVTSLKEDHEQRPTNAGELLLAFRQALSQQGEIDESTGTWMADGGSSLRDELKPLRGQIEKLLLTNGEIKVEDRANLDALAHIVDLDESGVEALITSVEETLRPQLRPIQNFLSLVDKQLAEGDIKIEALYLTGDAVGWDQVKVDAVIQARSPSADGGQPDQKSPAGEKETEPPVPDKPRSEATSTPGKAGSGRWIAVVLVLLMSGGGWWYKDQQQQQAAQERVVAERRWETIRQEAAAWDKADSANTITAYETYQSESFATVAHKEEASRRIDSLRQAAADRSEQIRLTSIAAKKKAKTKVNSTGVNPPKNHVKQYLERFSLGSLSMVGSMPMDGKTWALIEDGAGGVHRVQVGDYIGENWGRIESIEDSRIDLTEIVSDGTGDWLRRPSSIKLQGVD